MDIEYHAALILPANAVVFMLVLLPLFLERFNSRTSQEFEAGSRKAQKTKILMRAVIFGTTFVGAQNLVRYTACLQCRDYILPLQYNSTVINKGLQSLFLIHRANLVQGMAPVMSKKWFEKILPRCMYGTIILFMVVYTKTALETQLSCERYIDESPFRFCAATGGSGSRISIIVGVIVNTLMVVFFVSLFAIPLYRTSTADIGQLNDKQKRSRNKLKRILIWSVVMTAINQLTTALLIVATLVRNEWVFVFMRMDDAINVWTSWAMIKRNRQTLNIICRRMQAQTSDQRRERSSTMLSVSSRSSMQSSHLQIRSICLSSDVNK